jgi:hypothetical protein
MAEHTDKVTIEHTTNPFIYFKGTEDVDASKNLSTLQGTGGLQGPKVTSGWTYAGMIKIQVKDSGNNVVDRWMPHYIPTP